MRVTIQQKADLTGRRPRYEGTRENVYELKIEIEGGYASPYRERIEIEYHGSFYRIEPVGDHLELSSVGLPGVRLSLHPQAVDKVGIRSGREES